jgi:hypothetical protein
MSYRQLTLQERYVIAHLKSFKLSIREIARRLHRHHSTISRNSNETGHRCHSPGPTGTTRLKRAAIGARPRRATVVVETIERSTRT